MDMDWIKPSNWEFFDFVGLTFGVVLGFSGFVAAFVPDNEDGFVIDSNGVETCQLEARLDSSVTGLEACNSNFAVLGREFAWGAATMVALLVLAIAIHKIANASELINREIGIAVLGAAAVVVTAYVTTSMESWNFYPKFWLYGVVISILTIVSMLMTTKFYQQKTR